LAGLFYDLFPGFKGGEKDIDRLLGAYNSSVSDEYRREMEGSGKAVGVSYHDVLMANLFYEVTGVINTPLDKEWGPTLARSCTSIVAQVRDFNTHTKTNDTITLWCIVHANCMCTARQRDSFSCPQSGTVTKQLPAHICALYCH
jgi:hypothetical protein